MFMNADKFYMVRRVLWFIALKNQPPKTPSDQDLTPLRFRTPGCPPNSLKVTYSDSFSVQSSPKTTFSFPGTILRPVVSAISLMIALLVRVDPASPRPDTTTPRKISFWGISVRTMFVGARVQKGALGT